MVRSLILKKQDRGEADELVVFLTKEFGWLRGVAKNAKKSRVRFGGHLEPFSLVDLMLRSRKKDDLVWIDEAQMVEGFPSIRTDLAKLSLAAYFLEVASLFLPENQADPAVFDFVLEFLGTLDSSKPAPIQSILDEIRLLSLLGYAPRFDACPECGKKFKPGEEARFSLSHGGAAHIGCITNGRKDLVLSADTLALLRRGLQSEAGIASRLRLSQKGRAELRSALSAFVRYLRGTEINSLAFLEKMNLET